MPGEKSAVDEFLGGLNKAPENPFTAEKDPFLQEEKEPEVDVEKEEVEEKPLPFNKDPKVQKYIDRQVKKALEDVKPRETDRFREESRAESDEITDVLERIIGNDTPEKQQGVKDLRKVLGGLEDKAATRALQQFQLQAEQQVAADRAAAQELEDSFDEIEDTYSVDLSSNSATAKKTRSEFVDYIRRFSPKNDAGEVISFGDIPAMYEEFQERQKRAASVTVNRAKNLASQGMTRSTDASAAPVAKGQGWSAVDKIFSKLTS